VYARKPGASTPDEARANQKKKEKKAAKIAGRQYTKCPKDYGINGAVQGLISLPRLAFAANYEHR
jgi:hypothetical protein